MAVVGAPLQLPMPGADVRYNPDFLAPDEARSLFEMLLANEAWRQSRRRMYDRDIDVPRLQVWYGDPGGVLDDPLPGAAHRPWPPVLAALRPRIEAAVGERFNAVLLNLYRDGRDSVAWHSDVSPFGEPETTVASLSLGVARRFMFRPKGGGAGEQLAFDLPAGSLLVMGRGCQTHWEHYVPKTARPVGPRINLTFRVVPRPSGR